MADAEHLNSQGEKLASEYLGVAIQDLNSRIRPATGFRAWSLWRVNDQMLPPRAVHVATRGEDAVILNWERGLSEIMPDENFVGTPSEALKLVELFTSMTRPHAIILHSPHDIPGLDQRDALHLVVIPPRAFRQDGNYVAEAQIWEDCALDRVRFLVTPHGIQTQTFVGLSNVGVAITLE